MKFLVFLLTLFSPPIIGFDYYNQKLFGDFQYSEMKTRVADNLNKPRLLKSSQVGCSRVPGAQYHYEQRVYSSTSGKYDCINRMDENTNASRISPSPLETKFEVVLSWRNVQMKSFKALNGSWTRIPEQGKKSAPGLNSQYTFQSLFGVDMTVNKTSFCGDRHSFEMEVDLSPQK